MKKILVLALCLFSVIAYAEDKIGGFTLSLDKEQQELEVQVTDPNKKGEFHFLVQVFGERKDDKVFLMIDSKSITEWHDSMIQLKEKYLEWKKTAEDNNVTDITKEFNMKLPKSHVCWLFGNKWYFSHYWMFKPIFVVDKNGTCFCAIKDNVSSTTNSYVQKFFLLPLSTEQDFDGIISNLDLNIATNHFNKQNDKQDLFK